MAQLNAFLKRQRLLPSTQDFARFQVTDRLLETVCLSCYSILGASSHVHGLDILEHSHRCPKSHREELGPKAA